VTGLLPVAAICLVNALLLLGVLGRMLRDGRRYRSLARRLDLHLCPDRGDVTMHGFRATITVHQLRARLRTEHGRDQPYCPAAGPPPTDREATCPIIDPSGRSATSRREN